MAEADTKPKDGDGQAEKKKSVSFKETPEEQAPEAKPVGDAPQPTQPPEQPPNPAASPPASDAPQQQVSLLEQLTPEDIRDVLQTEPEYQQQKLYEILVQRLAETNIKVVDADLRAKIPAVCAVLNRMQLQDEQVPAAPAGPKLPVNLVGEQDSWVTPQQLAEFQRLQGETQKQKEFLTPICKAKFDELGLPWNPSEWDIVWPEFAELLSTKSIDSDDSDTSQQGSPASSVNGDTPASSVNGDSDSESDSGKSAKDSVTPTKPEVKAAEGATPSPTPSQTAPTPPAVNVPSPGGKQPAQKSAVTAPEPPSTEAKKEGAPQAQTPTPDAGPQPAQTGQTAPDTQSDTPTEEPKAAPSTVEPPNSANTSDAGSSNGESTENASDTTTQSGTQPESDGDKPGAASQAKPTPSAPGEAPAPASEGEATVEAITEQVLRADDNLWEAYGKFDKFWDHFFLLAKKSQLPEHVQDVVPPRVWAVFFDPMKFTEHVGPIVKALETPPRGKRKPVWLNPSVRSAKTLCKAWLYWDSMRPGGLVKMLGHFGKGGKALVDIHRSGAESIISRDDSQPGEETTADAVPDAEPKPGQDGAGGDPPADPSTPGSEQPSTPETEGQVTEDGDKAVKDDKKGDEPSGQGASADNPSSDPADEGENDGKVVKKDEKEEKDEKEVKKVKEVKEVKDRKKEKADRRTRRRPHIPLSHPPPTKRKKDIEAPPAYLTQDQLADSDDPSDDDAAGDEKDKDKDKDGDGDGDGDTATEGGDADDDKKKKAKQTKQDVPLADPPDSLAPKKPTEAPPALLQGEVPSGDVGNQSQQTTVAEETQEGDPAGGGVADDEEAKKTKGRKLQDVPLAFPPETVRGSVVEVPPPVISGSTVERTVDEEEVTAPGDDAPPPPPPPPPPSGDDDTAAPAGTVLGSDARAGDGTAQRPEETVVEEEETRRAERQATVAPPGHTSHGDWRRWLRGLMGYDHEHDDVETLDSDSGGEERGDPSMSGGIGDPGETVEEKKKKVKEEKTVREVSEEVAAGEDGIRGEGTTGHETSKGPPHNSSDADTDVEISESRHRHESTRRRRRRKEPNDGSDAAPSSGKKRSWRQNLLLKRRRGKGRSSSEGTESWEEEVGSSAAEGGVDRGGTEEKEISIRKDSKISLVDSQSDTDQVDPEDLIWKAAKDGTSSKPGRLTRFLQSGLRHIGLSLSERSKHKRAPGHGRRTDRLVDSTESVVLMNEEKVDDSEDEGGRKDLHIREDESSNIIEPPQPLHPPHNPAAPPLINRKPLPASIEPPPRPPKDPLPRANQDIASGSVVEGAQYIGSDALCDYYVEDGSGCAPHKTGALSQPSLPKPPLPAQQPPVGDQPQQQELHEHGTALDYYNAYHNHPELFNIPDRRYADVEQPWLRAGAESVEGKARAVEEEVVELERVQTDQPTMVDQRDVAEMESNESRDCWERGSSNAGSQILVEEPEIIPHSEFEDTPIQPPPQGVSSVFEDHHTLQRGATGVSTSFYVPPSRAPTGTEPSFGPLNQPPSRGHGRGRGVLRRVSPRARIQKLRRDPSLCGSVGGDSWRERGVVDDEEEEVVSELSFNIEDKKERKKRVGEDGEVSDVGSAWSSEPGGEMDGQRSKESGVSSEVADSEKGKGVSASSQSHQGRSTTSDVDEAGKIRAKRHAKKRRREMGLMDREDHQRADGSREEEEREREEEEEGTESVESGQGMSKETRTDVGLSKEVSELEGGSSRTEAGAGSSERWTDSAEKVHAELDQWVAQTDEALG